MCACACACVCVRVCVCICVRVSIVFALLEAQGLDLDPLRIDLAGVREAGQAYVALSRGKRQGGMQAMCMHCTRLCVRAVSRSTHASIPYQLGSLNAVTIVAVNAFHSFCRQM